ncbi:MAG: hypothetical protein WJU30_00573 [Candidatus Phytoplasma pruni]
MKRFGLLCQTCKNKNCKRTRTNKYIPYANVNLIKNNFQASRPLQKLCTDITYLSYGRQQIMYLVVIMDLYNREIIAYHMANKMDFQMIIQALNYLPIIPPRLSFSFGPRNTIYFKRMAKRPENQKSYS